MVVINDRSAEGGKGRVYDFQPEGLDRWSPHSGTPAAGTPVRLSKKSGVGQPKGPFRFVEHAETGEFHGLVQTGSLKPRKK